MLGINTQDLFVDGVVWTKKIRSEAVSDAVTFTGSGAQGTLVSGDFSIQEGRVLIIAAGFIRRPSENSSNFGEIAFRLKMNGSTIKEAVAFYDDNFAFGVPMVHEFNTFATDVQNFSFHADNLSGPGIWAMFPGSTLTLVNLRR